jgi:hypothetical protein
VLLEKGADPNATDSDGLTPLQHLAIQVPKDFKQLAKLLVDHGASTDVRVTADKNRPIGFSQTSFELRPGQRLTDLASKQPKEVSAFFAELAGDKPAFDATGPAFNGLTEGFLVRGYLFDGPVSLGSLKRAVEIAAERKLTVVYCGYLENTVPEHDEDELSLPVVVGQLLERCGANDMGPHPVAPDKWPSTDGAPWPDFSDTLGAPSGGLEIYLCAAGPLASVDLVKGERVSKGKRIRGASMRQEPHYEGVKGEILAGTTARRVQAAVKVELPPEPGLFLIASYDAY